MTVASADTFGAVRALAAFRLTGASRDYVIIGSDSGRIVILDYRADKGTFVKVRHAAAAAAAACLGGCGGEVQRQPAAGSQQQPAARRPANIKTTQQPVEGLAKLRAQETATASSRQAGRRSS